MMAKNAFNRISYLVRRPYMLLVLPISRCLPTFSFLHNTSDYQGKVSFEFWFKQKILNLGGNRKAYWPVHWTSKVYDVENILVGVDAYPGIMGGCYITGRGGIEIGDYTQTAPNVVIVSANHDVYDSRKHISEKVTIGKYCWIGAGAKILPGVTLGDWTIVAAGAVVTKSFPNGYCIIAGVPAIIQKELDRSLCIPFEVNKKYNGYINKNKFDQYRKSNLKV